jgi:hypothetical protein
MSLSDTPSANKKGALRPLFIGGLGEADKPMFDKIRDSGFWARAKRAIRTK